MCVWEPEDIVKGDSVARESRLDFQKEFQGDVRVSSTCYLAGPSGAQGAGDLVLGASVRCFQKRAALGPARRPHPRWWASPCLLEP